MNFKLFIDTSDQNQVLVKLYKENILIAQKSEIRKLSSQILLPLIDEICRENKIKPDDISEIEINKGPGSYTGLKVGAAIANAFGWYLKIPVNGVKNKIINPVFVS